MNKFISSLIALAIAGVVFYSTIFVVDQRSHAIVFALGEVKAVISEPGLHFKLPPPFQNVMFLDKRILTIESPEADRFITAEKKEPFAVRLIGTAESAHIHVVKLPAGTAVKSPAEAHLGQVNYRITREKVEVIGFYSRNHKGIFTHHDSNLHMHLITADRKKMGHLDDITFQAEVKLLLPQPLLSPVHRK